MCPTIRAEAYIAKGMPHRCSDLWSKKFWKWCTMDIEPSSPSSNSYFVPYRAMWWATKCKQYVTLTCCAYRFHFHTQSHVLAHVTNECPTYTSDQYKKHKGPKHNLILPKVRTSMAKNVLNFSAARSWNKLQRYQRITFNQYIFAETENIPEIMSVIDIEHNCCENNLFFLYTRLSRIKIIFQGSLPQICFIFVEGWPCLAIVICGYSIKRNSNENSIYLTIYKPPSVSIVKHNTIKNWASIRVALIKAGKHLYLSLKIFLD